MRAVICNILTRFTHQNKHHTCSTLISTREPYWRHKFMCNLWVTIVCETWSCRHLRSCYQVIKSFLIFPGMNVAVALFFSDALCLNIHLCSSDCSCWLASSSRWDIQQMRGVFFFFFSTSTRISSFKEQCEGCVVEHCECQQNQQQLGSLEVLLDQLWHSLGLHHLIDGAVCS